MADQARWELLQAAPTVALAVSSAAGSSRLVGQGCILVGWSIRETSGAAAAALTLYNGSDQTTQLVAGIGIVSGGSVVEGVGADGPFCDQGLFVHQESGAWSGAVWVKTGV